jgi:glutamyl-tRNA reductase
VFVVVGLSHKTAAIEVRERVALGAEAAESALRALHEADGVSEAIVLSTCNRVEVVLCSPHDDAARVQEVAASILDARSPGIAPHLYKHAHAAAVRHLFRVAASLDSLVLGEPQILGQVKDAFELAQKNGTLGPELNRLVTRAIRAAKRVRTETTIGTGQVSVPSVAADLAAQIFGDLPDKRVAFIGSGEMGEGVAKLLCSSGAKLIVVGRTAANVEALANRIGGQARTLDALDATLAEVDIVVTTTSAPHYVVSYDAVHSVRKKRRGRSMFLIDLAVPRDVDPRVQELDGVFLYNIDDLSQVVAEAVSLRAKEADEATQIIEQEVSRFERAASAELVTPTVVAMRQRFRGTLDAELERSLKGKLRHLSPEDRDAVERLFDAALNKLFHEPTRRLRRLATERPGAAELDATVDALHQIFGIDITGEGDLRSWKPSEPAPSEPSEDAPETASAALLAQGASDEKTG